MYHTEIDYVCYVCICQAAPRSLRTVPSSSATATAVPAKARGSSHGRKKPSPASALASAATVGKEWKQVSALCAMARTHVAFCAILHVLCYTMCHSLPSIYFTRLCVCINFLYSCYIMICYICVINIAWHGDSGLLFCVVCQFFPKVNIRMYVPRLLHYIPSLTVQWLHVLIMSNESMLCHLSHVSMCAIVCAEWSASVLGRQTAEEEQWGGCVNRVPGEENHLLRRIAIDTAARDK